MYILTRKSKGFGMVMYLGVFDTERAARNYEKRCMSCHESNKYEYDLVSVAYFKGENQ
jgi:hypothetical protein